MDHPKTCMNVGARLACACSRSCRFSKEDSCAQFTRRCKVDSCRARTSMEDAGRGIYSLFIVISLILTMISGYQFPPEFIGGGSISDPPEWPCAGSASAVDRHDAATGDAVLRRG